MSESASAPSGVRQVPLATVAVGAWCIVVGSLVILGADLMWVVVLGDLARAGGTAPGGIPFAAAPQVEWHSPILLAEIFLSLVHAFGGAALAGLQVALVAGTLLVTVAEGRRLGGNEVRVALVLSLTVMGTSSALVVTRLPSLSLLPFVLTIALLRRQHERPDHQIWWLVPLFIVWGNLHGAVLVGLAVLGVFLVASPAAGSVARRLGVGAGCALSLVITSAGVHTPAYYVGALSNEAAARGTDLWARPDLSHPLDLVMLVVAAILLVLASRRRPPLWEWLAIAGLAVGTLSAARHGVWLIFFLAPAALRSAARSGASQRGRAWWGATVTTVVVAGAAVGFQLGQRLDAVRPSGAAVVPTVQALAGDRVVLSDEPLAETLAQAGVTVWASNPIDAFTRTTQGEFLDFVQSGVVPRDAAIDLVVVVESRAPSVISQGWAPTATRDGFVVLERKGPSTSEVSAD